jgi:CheY-like chemotaxis protein
VWNNPGLAAPRRVLVVEDNPADLRLIREALAEANPAADILAAADADQAVALLESGAADLVLLDLNLPRADGHELLATLRSDPRWAPLPVVVFSSSDSPADIRRAYQGMANCYVTKPGQLDQFLDAVGRIERFWLRTARLPR